MVLIVSAVNGVLDGQFATQTSMDIVLMVGEDQVKKRGSKRTDNGY